MKRIQIPKANTPKEYLAVRVQIVHVKKGLLGLKDKELSRISVIPNEPKEAVNLFNKVCDMTGKMGIPFPVK